MKPEMDKDRLAAFVDGELAPEEAAAVVMHLADHPLDQAHVDKLIAANELLGAAYDGPLHEPVPEAIRAAIMGEPAARPEVGARVLPFRSKARIAAWAGGALALAAALATVTVLMPGRTGPGDMTAGGTTAGGFLPIGPLAAGSDVTRAVAELASLMPETLAGGQQVMILATMQMADGRFCREVEIVDQAAARLEMGLACSAPQGGWTVEVALQESLDTDGADAGFVTASGPEARTLALFLDREGAGAALDPAAELAAIASGWTR